MSISTETESLINLYTQKIELDNKQLNQINLVQEGYSIRSGVGESDTIKIWGPVEIIDSYAAPIQKIDIKVSQINDQIKTLQNQTLSIGQTANGVGCGTTGWSVGFTTITVYEDQLKYKGYSFSGSNPFNSTEGNLTSVNAGVGTYTYINQVSIGTYYGPIDVCNGFGCTAGLCVSYASSITNINNQIAVLQTQRNDLLNKVNFLKSGRIGAELQNYAYNQSKTKLNQSIGISSSILSFLKDPANEEWL